MPESFNTNISHQLFDYKITSVNSQHYTTQLKKVILYSKLVLKVRFKDFWYTKINLNQIWHDEFNE